MDLRRAVHIAALAFAGVALFAPDSFAQATNYYRKGTFSIGGGFNQPVGDMSNYLNSSGSMMIAGGRRLGPSNVIQVEWNHHWLGIKPEVLDRAESDSVQFDNAYASNWSVTLNFVRKFNAGGDYVPWITGGAGYYKRNLQITQNALVYYPPIWDPWWGWIDGGWYPGEAITGAREANGFGWNAGLGIDLTIDAGASLFVDFRYHEAVLNGVDTKIIPLMFGVRW